MRRECTTWERPCSRAVVFPSFSCYENTVLRWLASPTFSKNMKSCKEAANKESHSHPDRNRRAKISHIQSVNTEVENSGIRSYNEEAGSHEHSFNLHVQVQWKLDAKVVRVCEHFLQQAAPLLADAADGFVTIFALQLRSNGNVYTCRWENYNHSRI